MQPRPRWFAWLSALVAAGGLALPSLRANWPQLRGGPQRTGFSPETLTPPFRLAWAVEFSEERLGTAMEAIVAEGRVFVATHAGNLYALDARTGTPQWRFEAAGPLLHSPAYADGRVVAADTAGGVYALEAATGRLVWARHPEGADGGFAASPLVAEGRVLLGARSGLFVCLDLAVGAEHWRAFLPAPVRQPAALAGDRVVVTAEDLVARAFALRAERTARPLWETPLVGQSARDYPPVILSGPEGRCRVVIRTSPLVNMAQRLARDRQVLTRHAGVDDSDWRKIEAWTRSEAARGNPELWRGEQEAIRAHLAQHPEAQTCFVLDAPTGRPAPPPPILWAAGCQGVGAPPTLTADGRWLVFYRTAYGNWNLGVAPLVALGLWEPEPDRITLLLHEHGSQPPWNTFWGTADETQHFTVAGNLVLITHQGTLSGFDLGTRRLHALHGERDTYGGFRNPPWARNEWHGPGRGGAAVSGGRVYWLTGSRVLCLAAGESGEAAAVQTIQATAVSGARAPRAPRPDLRAALRAAVREVLERRWAPLLVEPGLAGREFFFTHSGEAFAALAWAWPHLAGDPLQEQVRAWLATEWERRPPFAAAGAYALPDGARREWHPLTGAEFSRLGQDPPPHPFGHLEAVWLYAARVGESNRVRAAWPRLREVFTDWRQTGWRLDGARGDRYANRYLGALLALERLASLAGDESTVQRARTLADATARELAAWWRRAAEQSPPGMFRGVVELDPFIGNGDALFHKIFPHRHKLALLLDLTPGVVARVCADAPDAVDRVWSHFARLHATWWLAGEERQVHFGENFADPPDLALGAFQALAWLRGVDAEELARRVDRPFCRADLYHVTKLALALEAAAAPAGATSD